MARLQGGTPLVVAVCVAVFSAAYMWAGTSFAILSTVLLYFVYVVYLAVTTEEIMVSEAACRVLH
jgi:hypothetical protein